MVSAAREDKTLKRKSSSSSAWRALDCPSSLGLRFRMASFRTAPFFVCLIGVLAVGACGGSSSAPFQSTGNKDGGGTSGTSADGGGLGNAGIGGASGAGQAGSGGTSSGTPLADLPAQFAPAVCDTAAQCYGPLLGFLLGGNACTDLLTKQLAESDFALLQAAVTKGTVQYDGTKVAACLDAVKKEGCAILSTRLSTLCADVLHGTVAAGRPCTFGAECSPGLFCKTTACPGVCTSLLAEGAACEADGNCQDGLTCSDSKVCTKAVAIDLSGAEGTTCDPTAAKLCQADLACAAVAIAGGAAAFKCEKPATGATCHVAFPEECAAGEYCVLPANTFNGTCTPLPSAGQPCGKYSPTDKRRPCGPGAVCDTTSGNCVAFQDLGKACTADNQCYSKSCGQAGTCVAAKCAN
jgi:hypothetical protein